MRKTCTKRPRRRCAMQRKRLSFPFSIGCARLCSFAPFTRWCRSSCSPILLFSILRQPKRQSFHNRCGMGITGSSLVLLSPGPRTHQLAVLFHRWVAKDSEVDCRCRWRGALPMQADSRWAHHHHHHHHQPEQEKKQTPCLWVD